MIWIISVIYILLPLPGIALYYGLGGAFWDGFNAWSLSPALGIAAFSWFAGQFWLAAKPFGLDRAVGLKPLYRLHGTGGLAAVLAGVVHFVCKFFLQGTEPSLQTLFGMTALIVFVLVVAVSILLMAMQFPAPARVLKDLRQKAAKTLGLGYQRLRAVHNVVVVAAAAMLVHVFMAFSTRQHWILMLWMGFIAAGGLVLYARYRLKGRKT